MSLAFTGGNIKDTQYTITSAGVGAFIDGLRAILVSAGWTSVPIAEGFEFTITSPQGLTAQVRIWNPAEIDHIPYVYVQFQPDGVRHRLGVEIGRVYRVWANRCQLFIGIDGVSEHTPYWNTMCGGIPWVPNVAGADPAITDIWGVATSVWWSEGGGNLAQVMCSLRNELNNWTSLPYGRNFFSTCYNGDVLAEVSEPLVPFVYPSHSHVPFRALSLQNAGFSPEVVDPRQPPPSPTRYWTSPPSVFYNDRPAFLEPYVAWGDPSALRGMLWDCVIASKQHHSLDELVDFDELYGVPSMAGLRWRQFTATDADAYSGALGSWYGEVYLFSGVPAVISVANCAY